jgi:hypothetical protein
MLLLAGCVADVLLVPTIPEYTTPASTPTNHIFYNATDAGATA